MNSFIKLTTLIYCMVMAIDLSANPKDFHFQLHKPDSPFRWEKVNGQSFKGSMGQLRKVKDQYNKKNYKDCFKLAASQKNTYKVILDWILYQQLLCAQEQMNVTGKSYWLRQAVAEVGRKESFWSKQVSSPMIRTAMIQSLLTLLREDVKKDRSLAWERFNQIEGQLIHMDLSQKALLYKLAGDLSFVQQKLYMAHSFYQRSAYYEPSSEISQKIQAIEAKFLPSKSNVDSQMTEAGSNDLEVTKEELKIYNRMSEALQTGDLTSAVEDGVLLIQKFPGGVRADWAFERIYEILTKVLMAKKSEYHLIKLSLRDDLKKCDGEHLGKWAQRLFNKGYYHEAAVLSRLSYEKLKDQPSSERPLKVLSFSYFYIGKYNEALDSFRELFEKFSGRSSSHEALFWMGLIHYRKKNYSDSTASFEKLLALDLNEDVRSSLRMKSRYWLWRSQQKLQSERIYDEAYKLVKEFPLTYYGLKARNFLLTHKAQWPATIAKDQVIDWGDIKDPPINVQVWWTDQQQKIWQKISLLLKAGWFEEVQNELASFMEPRTPKEKLLLAYLWSLSFNHYESVRWTYSAIDEDPTLMTKTTLSWLFPVEYTRAIQVESKKRSLPPALLLGLIKQESSFRSKAESSAQALGLMQMVRLTAFEVKEDLKLKSFTFPDYLLQPDNNIKMGSYYYAKLKRAFGGQYDYALAAYNAGIGNVKRWMEARDMKVFSRKDFTLNTLYNEDPENEIWMDELPWKETRHYVKAILRNYIMYNLLYPSSQPQ